MIDVRVIREPLSRSVDMHRLPIGLTVAGIVARVTRLPHARVILGRDGIEWEVRPEYFDRVRPTPGTSVTVAPQIGATALVPLVVSAFGVSTMTATLIVAGVAVGLSLMAHFMFAPGDADGKRDKDNPMVRGLQNALALPGQPLPMVLGRHRMAPLRVATGYTEMVGQTVYRHERMTFGVGPIALAQIKIGTTAIHKFRGVEIQLRGCDEALTRAAMPALNDIDCTFLADDAPMTLYSRNVFEDAEQAKLTYGQPVTRDTPENTARARVQISFAGLVKITDKGKKHPRTRKVRISYRAASSEDAWVTASEESYTGKTTATLRFGERIVFPSAGAWSIMVERLTPDATDDQVYDDTYLEAIQSIEPGSLPSIPGTAEIALRIKATDQINGALDPVNAVVQQLAPVWTGADFSAAEPVSHPADIVVALMRGAVRKKPVPDARIDLDGLRAWKLAWPHWRYDGVITGDLTLGALVDQVLAVGLAMRDVRDARHTALTDLSASPAVQLWTPRNTRDYAAEMVKPPEVHALRVRYTSEYAGWKDDEVICYANGYSAATATEIETLEIPGLVLAKGEAVTRMAQLAYYHLAQIQNRQTSVSFTADLDHVLCGRGDPVLFSSDALRNSYGDGRIIGVTHSGGDIATIALDNDLSLAEGSAVHILWRASSGALQYVTATRSGDIYAVTPGSGVRPGGAFDAEAIAVGDVATLYEVETAPAKWLVKEIVPETGGTARVVLTEATTVPLDDLSRPLPEYDPRVIGVNEAIGLAGAIEYENGAMYVALRWSVLDPAARPSFRVTLEDSAGNTVGQMLTGHSFARFEVQGVFSQTFTASVVVLADDDLPSEAKTITLDTSAQFAAPGNVSGFLGRVVGEVLYLEWASAAGNVDSHEIRYSPEVSGATWGTSVPLLPRAAGQLAQVPARNGSYLIKAGSFQGQVSATASMVVVTSAGPLPNAVETLALAPEFDGTMDNGLTVLGDELVFASDGVIADWATLDEVSNIGTHGRTALSATFEAAGVIDLGAVDTVRLSAAISAFGERADIVIADWETLAEVVTIGGTADGDWTVIPQVSITEDDPDGTPTWSDWSNITIGDYRARAFRFRIGFEVATPDILVRLSDVTFTVDMPDRIEKGADIVVGTGGEAIVFDPPYRALTALTVNPQGLPSGGTWEISGKNAAGFTITLKNSGGSAVAGTFDYHAIGYGREGE